MVRRIETLRFHSPLSAISELKVKHKHMNINLMSSINIYSINLRSFLREKTTKLRALNPTAILKRGYSITRTVPDAVIIRSSNQADIGQPLEILLGQGSLHVTVDTRNQAKKQ
jgi:exodeoxyribonuclease VII large subunit